MIEDAVTAVIPQWNRADLLTGVLQQLSHQTHPLAEVIVVDNGSTDDSVAVARAGGASVIALPSNAGFAAAVNRGVAAARTPWVLILNNDVELKPDWLGVLLSAASAAQANFAAGKLMSSDPFNLMGSDDIIDATFDAVCRGGTAWRCGAGQPDGPAWSQPRAIQFAPMTAAIFRKDLFDQIGSLDERFESYLEDIDFGLRCAAAGKRGIYVPAAVARHIGSATLGAWHKDTVRRLARNQMFIEAKHFQGAPRRPILVAQLLWGTIAMRHGCGRAWLRGRREGKRSAAQMRDPESWARVRNAVEASEREIRELQRSTRPDLYWRLYFALAGGVR